MLQTGRKEEEYKKQRKGTKNTCREARRNFLAGSNRQNRRNIPSYEMYEDTKKTDTIGTNDTT